MSATPLPLPIKLVKYAFIFFNILFVICGVCLIGVGSWLVASNQPLTFLFGNSLVGGGVLLILCGLATFVLAGVGVAGAFLQWRPLLVIFGSTLTFIVFIEVIAAILGFAFQDNLESSFSQSFLNAMRQVTTDNAVATSVFQLQSSLSCCGANSSSDWSGTPFGMQNMGFLPLSCCNVTVVPTCRANGTNVHQTGCVAAAEGLISSNIAVAAGLGVAGLLIGLVEVIGIVLSFGLCACIHRYKLQVV